MGKFSRSLYKEFICFPSETSDSSMTSETDEEEQQVDKEDKHPRWKRERLKEYLSKGS